MEDKEFTEYDQIHSNIVYYSRLAGMSVKQLAVNAGISETTLHSIKTGKFNYATLEAIAGALKVTVADLVKPEPKFTMSLDFGEKIKNYRSKRGINQGELGAAVGVSRQTIAKWEECLATPDKAQAEKVSEALAVRFDLIFGRQGRESKLDDSLSKIGSELDALRSELDNIRSLTNLNAEERYLIGYLREIPETDRLLKLWAVLGDQIYLDKYKKLTGEFPVSSVDTSSPSLTPPKHRR